MRRGSMEMLQSQDMHLTWGYTQRYKTENTGDKN
jgi:hypothetical protein